MTSSFSHDIIVAGTGPAGLIAALLLAHDGHRVALAGPLPNRADRRTTALMSPSLGVLERVGVLENVARGAAELRSMRIVDATGRLVRAPTVTFRAAEIGEQRFGINIPNAHLLDVLADAVSAEPLIDWRQAMVESYSLTDDRATAILSDGNEIAGKLLVAADGRGSRARDAAGITVRSSTLPQAALVANFAHSRPHGFISTEFHTETGPFTQVPLPGDRSSLVWVLRPADAERMKGWDDARLSQAIEQRMGSMLGHVAVESGRQAFPLTTLTPSTLARSRTVLVGEAAHVFPPIGAQGLNLGIRDIADLASVAAAHRDDPGSPAALSAYDRRRRLDVTARSTAVNLLNGSLLSSLLPAQMARSVGLAALDAFAPLRGFFMREGLVPGSGFAGLGDMLRLPLRERGPAAARRT